MNHNYDMQQYNIQENPRFIDLNTLDKVFWEEEEQQNIISARLYYAICRDNYADISSLILQGANVNTRDMQGNSLVYVAAMKGHIDVLKILIAHSANFEIANTNGCKPIYAAATCNQLDAVKYLVQIGADLGLHGYTLLHRAATNNDIILIDLLINRGLDLNIHDELGLTALHYAAQHESLDAIKYLVSKGANMNIPSNDGHKPLDYAICYSKYHSIMLLCSLGADIVEYFWYFWKYANQISIDGPLAQNLAAALNIYCTFFQNDEDFKNSLLKNITFMVEAFEKESDIDKIKGWLEDKSLGCLNDLVDQMHSLSQSYNKIQYKLKESNLTTDRKLQTLMKKVDLNTLSNLLQEYHLELLQKATSLGYVRKTTLSLLRLKHIDASKDASLNAEELFSVSLINISDLSKLAAQWDDTEVYNEGPEIREILGSAEFDELQETLDTCAFYDFP